MRISFKLNLTSQFWKVAYKLTHDALFLLLAFFLGTLILEGMLPGIISDHIGTYKIIFLIALNIAAIGILWKKIGNVLPRAPANKNSSHKIIGATIFIFILLILNSLIRLKLFFVPLFIFLIAASIYFSYKVIFEKERSKNKA